MTGPNITLTILAVGSFIFSLVVALVVADANIHQIELDRLHSICNDKVAAGARETGGAYWPEWSECEQIQAEWERELRRRSLEENDQQLRELHDYVKGLKP